MNGRSAMKRTASTSSSLLPLGSDIPSLSATPRPAVMLSSLHLCAPTPCPALAAYEKRSFSTRPALPLDLSPAAINQRLLVRPFDLDLHRRGPRRFFERDLRFVGRQAIVPGAVERGKGLELVQRAFLFEYLGVGFDRDRRVEQPRDAVHGKLLRHRMGRGIGAEERAGLA